MQESTTEGEDDHHQTSRRPQRTRYAPVRFDDYEINTDDDVNDEGELVHIALMANSEPISELETMKHTVRKGSYD